MSGSRPGGGRWTPYIDEKSSVPAAPEGRVREQWPKFNANYTNIYFLEKPKDLYLEFYDHATSTIYSLKDVNEGDILTVPSYIPCRVPENTTSKKLTLIIFNTQISVVDYGK